MGSAVMEFPQEITVKPRDLSDLVGLPSETEHALKQLSGTANELVHSVGSMVDGMIARTMSERTAEGFVKARNQVFPRYFAVMVALGALIRVTVPERDLDRLISESLCELEADFRDLGLAAFGADLRNRGIFTVWTLRKIRDLAAEFSKKVTPPSSGKECEEAAKNFAASAMFARFHIDCLVRSMRSGTAIFPAVVDSIVDGLRAVVNAYAWIRQAVDGTEKREPEFASVPWDEEDEMLLADSMRDIAHDES